MSCFTTRLQTTKCWESVNDLKGKLILWYRVWCFFIRVCNVSEMKVLVGGQSVCEQPLIRQQNPLLPLLLLLIYRRSLSQTSLEKTAAQKRVWWSLTNESALLKRFNWWRGRRIKGFYFKVWLERIKNVPSMRLQRDGLGFKVFTPPPLHWSEWGTQEGVLDIICSW